MIKQPDFDIVLWGASGFVGKLVAEHLYQRYGVGGRLRWAIGGKDELELNTMRASLGGDAATLPVLVGDAHDRQFLDSMVNTTKVVLSTVGPYTLYGKALVAACAASGTDYCDLAGEIPFVQEMIDQHADQARASGARILNCCGVDSLPSDLGVWSLNDIAQKRFGCGIKHVATEVKSFKGLFSGGTIASLGGMFNDAARDDNIASILKNPYAICPQGRRSGVVQPDINVVRRSESGAWLAPFFMAIVNTRVVHATNAHLGYPYGTRFTYNEGWDLGSRRAADFIALATRLFYCAYRSGSLRSLMYATFLPKPGTGPSKTSREKGDFEFQFRAITDQDQRLTLVVSGDRDPGYGASSRMIGEVAVCLAQDITKSALPGAIWTPAAAIARQLIPRLIANAGMKFELLSEAGERYPAGSELFGSAGLGTGESRQPEEATT